MRRERCDETVAKNVIVKEGGMLKVVRWQENLLSWCDVDNWY
jgi:hypothetical protein